MSNDIRFEVTIHDARGRQREAVVALSDDNQVSIYIPPGGPALVPLDEAKQLAAAIESVVSVAEHKAKRRRR